jgi:DNA gyrase subunit A
MALTSIGKMIRVDMGTIRKAGRNTSGVTIVNVDKGDKVVSIAMCPKENEEIELDEDGNPIKVMNEVAEVADTTPPKDETIIESAEQPSLIPNELEGEDK